MSKDADLLIVRIQVYQPLWTLPVKETLSKLQQMSTGPIAMFYVGD
jgi:hypothetical protein